MTFDEFQQSKHLSTNLGKELNDARWDGEPDQHGFVYEGGLYIEIIMDHWPVQDRGKYYLILNRDEWMNDDLEMLERKLYDFAVSEQIINEAA